MRPIAWLAYRPPTGPDLATWPMFCASRGTRLPGNDGDRGPPRRSPGPPGNEQSPVESDAPSPGGIRVKEEQVMASNESQPQQESDPQQLPEPDPAMASHKAQIHDRPRVARRTT
jgi:hypothetical protein